MLALTPTLVIKGVQNPSRLAMQNTEFSIFFFGGLGSNNDIPMRGRVVTSLEF